MSDQSSIHPQVAGYGGSRNYRSLGGIESRSSDTPGDATEILRGPSQVSNPGISAVPRASEAGAGQYGATSSVDTLNQFSEAVLDGLAWVGEAADHYGLSNRIPSLSEEIALSTDGAGEGVPDLIANARAQVARRYPVLDSTGVVLKPAAAVVSFLGNAFQAATNTADFLSAFNQEYKAGSSSYEKTMKQGLKSVAVTGTSFAAGGYASIAAASALAVVGAPAVASVAVGVGVAVVAGWAMGSFVNWIGSER